MDTATITDSLRVNMARKKSAPAAAPTPSSAVGKPETVEVKAGAFKDTCLELMDDVHDRVKEVVITKYGRAVAKLVAPDTELPSAFGFLRGTVVAQGDIVSPDFEAWDDLE